MNSDGNGIELLSVAVYSLLKHNNPAHPAVIYLAHDKTFVERGCKARIDEIVARYPVAGIHLDFIRWGDGVAKPANAAVPVSQFVTAARQRVKRPRWLTTAVYGKYPQCVASVGQNWVSWLDASLVDYVVPMDYTSSLQTLNELLAMQSGTQLRRQRTIVGLGVTANESHLDAKQVIDQINLTRRYGFAGNALFDLDTTLERNVLPYLRLGLW